MCCISEILRQTNTLTYWGNIMEEQYNELWKMWEAKFGAHRLGEIGRRYLIADFVDRKFEILTCRADKRTRVGYSYKVSFSTHDFEQMKTYIEQN